MRLLRKKVTLIFIRRVSKNCKTFRHDDVDKDDVNDEDDDDDDDDDKDDDDDDDFNDETILQIQITDFI